MREAIERGWDAPPGAPVPFITAGFDVRFLRPTPLGPPVHLVARPERVDAREIVVHSELVVDEKVRATMLATWRRFRPR
jgi:acyl-coenzyme A thioesterase PaaI-like protein